MFVGKPIGFLIESYAEAACVRDSRCQITCSIGPTRKTQNAVPVRATPARIINAQ
jgi:hypothetical protein